MLYAIFFDSSGPVVQMPCPPGHTVTGRFYKNSVMKKVKEFYNKKRPSKGWSGVHLLHDNASSHKCEVVKSLFWLLKRQGYIRILVLDFGGYLCTAVFMLHIRTTALLTTPGQNLHMFPLLLAKMCRGWRMSGQKCRYWADTGLCCVCSGSTLLAQLIYPYLFKRLLLRDATYLSFSQVCIKLRSYVFKSHVSLFTIRM